MDKAATAVKAAHPYERGQHLFIYCHARTNQTIYSLTRAMTARRSLKQLPFLGKKTKPANIRKDFWRPLATVSFPNSHQGKEAYRQLLEFKVRHEHEWTHKDLETKITYDDRGRPHYDRLDAGRRLRDQKANSIADLAFVLGTQQKLARRHQYKTLTEERAVANAKEQATARIKEITKQMEEALPKWQAGDDEAKALYKELKAEKMRTKRHLQLPRPDMAMNQKYHPLNDKTPMPKHGERKTTRLRAQIPRLHPHGVKIAWADVHDAEFASEWPHLVVHDELARGGNRTRHTPESPHDLEARRVTLANTAEAEQASSRPTGAARATSRPTETAKPQTRLQKLLVRLRDGAV